MTSTRRNLVISPVGDGSMNRTWLAGGGERSFDLFLIHYGNQPGYGRQDADYYLERRGFKWELLDYVVGEYRSVIKQYDSIWCPDCDIRAHTADINRLFDICREHRLQLAQPAIAAGEITYQFLRPRAGVLLRYSPFVEVMCPVFSREALCRLQPTFLESRSGWGLDVLWPRYFGPREMAVVDAVGVEHTGRLFRGENYQSLDKLGVSPGAELDRIIARHGGFNRRLHRRLVRGRVKLPAIWSDPPEPSFTDKVFARLGFSWHYA